MFFVLDGLWYGLHVRVGFEVILEKLLFEAVFEGGLLFSAFGLGGVAAKGAFVWTEVDHGLRHGIDVELFEGYVR